MAACTGVRDGGIEGGEVVELLGAGEIEVVAQAVVERELAADFPIVLRIGGYIFIAVARIVGADFVGAGIDRAQQETGDGIAGARRAGQGLFQAR